MTRNQRVNQAPGQQVSGGLDNDVNAAFGGIFAMNCLHGRIENLFADGWQQDFQPE